MQICTPKTTPQEVVELCEIACTEAGETLKSIHRAACITGPGGFSSLRIGVSILNTLSAMQSLPIVGIHEALLYKAMLMKPDAFWLHSTKKTQVFVQGFGKYSGQYNEPLCKELTEAQKILPDAAYICGELLPEHSEFFADKHLQQAELQSVDAVLPALLNTLEYAEQILQPWYGREW